MVRDYELMYIVRPDLDEDGVKATMDVVQTIVEGQGGEVRKTTPWGKRRLAYEINKLRDGHYVLLDLRLDGGRLKEIDRALRIHENVIRHMVTVRVAPLAIEEDGEQQAPVQDEQEPAAGGRGDAIEEEAAASEVAAEDVDQRERVGDVYDEDEFEEES